MSTLPRPSILENKKYIALTIIVAIIIISSIAVIRFGGDLFQEPLPPPPEGIGEIDSEHVHAAFAVILDLMFIDFDADTYDKYAKADPYIFMQADGTNNVVHRLATGVTLAYFFDTLGFTYTEDCFIVPKGVFTAQFKPFERSEYCNEGDGKFDYQVKLFVNHDLNEDGPNYIIQNRDLILLSYDDRNATKTTRSYAIGTK